MAIPPQRITLKGSDIKKDNPGKHWIFASINDQINGSTYTCHLHAPVYYGAIQPNEFYESL